MATTTVYKRVKLCTARTKIAGDSRKKVKRARQISGTEKEKEKNEIFFRDKGTGKIAIRSTIGDFAPLFHT